MSRCASFKLLDLCCGEGLGAWGYWLSGRFSEIVGMDIDNSKRERYAFDFIQGDVLKLTYEFLWQFDFIHASPPCQAYSQATPDQSVHPRLIIPIRQMLYASGVPHVVENVPGSQRELRPNLMMSGLAFGLPSHRPRFFYVSSLPEPMRFLRPAIDDHVSSGGRAHHEVSTRHSTHQANEKIASWSSSQVCAGEPINVSLDAQVNPTPAIKLSDVERINVHGGQFVPRADVIRALGLEVIPPRRLANITVDGMEQGIPPVFTRQIAELVIPEKVYIA